MIKKIISVLLSASVLMLGSCADEPVVTDQKPVTTITLSWWGNDSRNEYTLEAVERFEKLHPDIKVKCSYSEWQGYEARSRTQMISDTEADVMQINVGWLRQYSPDGTGYYDLEKVSDIISLDNFPKDCLEYGKRNGVLNAVPIAMNAETVYFNKSIYDRYGLEIPKTWDDLFEAAELMRKDGVYPLSGAAKSLWMYCIAYAEQKNGKHFFNDSDEITFTADDLQLMIDFYCRLVNEGVIPKVEDFQRYNIDNLVYAGLVGWVSDAMNYLQKPIDEGSEFIAGSYTADSPENSGVGWYEKPATLYAISKNTEHPKEAALLMDFMLNSTEWAELQGVEKGIPISDSVRDYLESKGDLSGIQYEASQVMENNDKISPMNSIIEDDKLYSSFIDACNLVLFDKATPEEAAAQLYEIYSESYAMQGG